MYISKIATAITVGLLMCGGNTFAQSNPNANPVSIGIDANISSVSVGNTRTVTFLLGNNGSNPIPAGGAYWIVSFPNTVTVNQASLFMDSGPFSTNWTVNGGGTILLLTTIAPGIPAKVFNGPKTNYSMTVTVTGIAPGGPLQFTLNAANEALIAGNGNSGDDNASSPFTVTPAPLPVQLVSFTATQKSCKALLDWTTAVEKNTDHFDVEVSEDGVKFVQAGSVKAAGNSNMEHHYSFSYDMKPEISYLFRLKIADKDGSYDYSQVQKVSCNERAASDISIAPNPVVSTVNIKGMNDGSNTITIFDVKGNKVKTIATTNHEMQLDLSGYVPGVYTIRIENENGNMVSKKIVKQ